jgi:hypothetical protein
MKRAGNGQEVEKSTQNAFDSQVSRAVSVNSSHIIHSQSYYTFLPEFWQKRLFCSRYLIQSLWGVEVRAVNCS